MELEDTGTIAEVPEDQQLDVDEGEDVVALYDLDHPGGDVEGLDAVYDDPGEVVDEEALQ